jgi:hypothetical protein
MTTLPEHPLVGRRAIASNEGSCDEQLRGFLLETDLVLSHLVRELPRTCQQDELASQRFPSLE